MKEKYDSEEFYCPKLGHHLTFKYCRAENSELPCFRIQMCCSAKIPVQEYLSLHYPDEVIAQIFKPRENKLTSILNLVANAQRIKNSD
jgi:hypothetical protein